MIRARSASEGQRTPAPRRPRGQRPRRTAKPRRRAAAAPDPQPAPPAPASHHPSRLIDTRVIYCGDCIDLIYIDPLFNSNRNTDRRSSAAA